MTNIARINLKGKSYDFILNDKTFSTGSKGFHGQGKIEVAPNEKYQVNLMLVLIGSKPKQGGEE